MQGPEKVSDKAWISNSLECGFLSLTHSDRRRVRATSVGRSPLPSPALAMGLLGSVSASFCLALSYVLSLYVWRSPHDRDHPETIKRRFVSALGMTLVSPVFASIFGAADLVSRHGVWASVGLRWEGLPAACVVPVGLTVVLFLGPLAVMVHGGAAPRMLLRPYYWRHCLSDLIWWRNHVVAPFTEEFTFRACMLPILLGYFTPGSAALVSPLFFGVAHLHHMAERLRQGQPLASAALISLFQMSYTTVFGVYSAFLFLRTGHLMAPVVVHGFCNFMGFPDFAEAANQPPRLRLVFAALYLAGVAAFFALLYPLTEPKMYHNIIYRW